MERGSVFVYRNSLSTRTATQRLGYTYDLDLQ